MFMVDSHMHQLLTLLNSKPCRRLCKVLNAGHLSGPDVSTHWQSTMGSKCHE